MLLRRVVRKNNNKVSLAGKVVAQFTNAVLQPAGRWGMSLSELHAPLQVTFLVHCLTVLINSEMTMSTHFTQGSLIFFTCFFTMVSKAMSGVKRPVLNTQNEGGLGGQDKVGGRCGVRMGQGECHSITYQFWNSRLYHR